MKKSLYDILDVAKTATLEEITKAYKLLAKQWHPDLNQVPDRAEEVEERFKEIGEAYDILKNPDKRKRYDETGETAGMSKDDEVRAILQALFIKELSNRSFSPEHSDIFENIKSIIVGKERTFTTAIKKHEGEIVKLNIIRSRIVKGQDYFAGLLNNNLEQFTKAISQMKQDIEIGKNCLEQLKDFKYRVDEQDESERHNDRMFHTMQQITSVFK